MSDVPALPRERVTVDRAGEVADLLRRDGDSFRWMAVGGATLLGRGGPPRGAVRELDLSRLDHILKVAHEDLTVTVQAGVRMSDLRDALAEKGLWLPVTTDPAPRSTVGGWIGADRRSPLAGAWGSLRDYLLGITFVTGEGHTARAGGRVVKNVAGYDLMKLFIGSLGELGIVLEATFKVLPQPRSWGAVIHRAPDEETLRAAGEEIALRLAPAGLWRAHLGDGEMLAAVFAGSGSRVAHQVESTRGLWGSNAHVLEGDAVHRLLAQAEALTRPEVRPVYWGGALPGSVVADSFRIPAAGAQWIADGLAGHLWIANLGVAEGIRMRAWARDAGAHLHRDVPSGWALADDAWDMDPGEERDLWMGLQQALDPPGRLVAGRLPGGI